MNVMETFPRFTAPEMIGRKIAVPVIKRDPNFRLEVDIPVRTPWNLRKNNYLWEYPVYSKVLSGETPPDKQPYYSRIAYGYPPFRAPSKGYNLPFICMIKAISEEGFPS
jgi:hypothetical protein